MHYFFFSCCISFNLQTVVTHCCTASLLNRGTHAVLADKVKALHGLKRRRQQAAHAQHARLIDNARGLAEFERRAAAASLDASLSSAKAALLDSIAQEIRSLTSTFAQPYPNFNCHQAAGGHRQGARAHSVTPALPPIPHAASKRTPICTQPYPNSNLTRQQEVIVSVHEPIRPPLPPPPIPHTASKRGRRGRGGKSEGPRAAALAARRAAAAAAAAAAKPLAAALHSR
ncbi:hypothetical protein JKP88DRAFT_250967 [Tribonema minus]|uniref:Uncharacterized protein n=1 Tax=Tribonema minus TaxID=303371 RepID=A0A836CP12_9STRA|nr:hypothetical protein JKP88DRAFT_250967 [Tribonema minus]